VRRDDLVTFHVDGTHGSAVCGLTDCWVQPRVATPKPVWNPDVPQTINFFEGWQKIPESQAYPNGFRAQWELFLRHVVGETKDYPWDLLAGAKGVQLAMAGLQSWKERRWIDLPPLEIT
jgi:predicted dehydrogenase